jgi:beta-galactosidase
VYEEAGAAPAVAGLPPRLEAVRRRGDDGRWLFLLNHADRPLRAAADGVDLLTGTEHDGEVEVPGGGVVVLREREA